MSYAQGVWMEAVTSFCLDFENIKIISSHLDVGVKQGNQRCFPGITFTCGK